MEYIVFAGPSLKGATTSGDSNIEFRPPAGCGDITKAALERPKAIGLIDGVFETAASSWHKEILWALSLGITVFGAASLGALRAVELAPFGMIGVGQVFNAYQSGSLEDDEEVAVQHGPLETGFVNLTTPMVNIRATINKAVANNIIETQQGETLTRCAKQIFYKDRTWEAVYLEGEREGMASESLQKLMAWLPTNEVDIKNDDARALLREMVVWESLQENCPDRPTFPNTIYWEQLLERLPRL